MDKFNLQRFATAQDGIFDTALAEIRQGRKASHWMWFIFPQLYGLGHSETARFYAIRSRDEARHYLEHPVLGMRLRQSVAALQALPDMTAEEVFGAIDALKLRSSLTLFAEAAPEETIFAAALERWFPGKRDERTLGLLTQAN